MSVTVSFALLPGWTSGDVLPPVQLRITTGIAFAITLAFAVGWVAASTPITQPPHGWNWGRKIASQIPSAIVSGRPKMIAVVPTVATRLERRYDRVHAAARHHDPGHDEAAVERAAKAGERRRPNPEGSSAASL